MAKTFTTGNSTVATLQPGSTLKVLGNGQVEVTYEAPKPAPKLGDLVVDSKGRQGTVVRVSTRGDFNPKKPIFVGKDNVVRNF